MPRLQGREIFTRLNLSGSGTIASLCDTKHNFLFLFSNISPSDALQVVHLSAEKNPQQTSWEAISLWKCQDPVRKWQILKEENCGASQQNVNVMIRWHDYQHYIVSGLCGFRAWLIRQIVSSLKYLTKSLVVMDTHRSGGPITSIQFDLIQSCFIPFDSP